MGHHRSISLALGITAAMLAAAACGETTRPVDAGTPSFGVKPPPPPPPKKDEGGCASFRLTGGGRIDQHAHTTPNPKSTPQSHDFATFGFQARPTSGCPNSTDGSGQFQWNEHNPDALGGGFAFHGTVTFFTTPTDGSNPEQCGRFGGFGRFNPRNGATEQAVPFEVNHACDVAEPGIDNDHISVTIGPTATPRYQRHALLTGGNIQKHRLTGNSN
jgi:hypothetical protein